MDRLPTKDQKLSSALAEALDACRRYEKERPTILGKGFENLTGPIGGLISSLVPPKWVASALEIADTAAEATMPSEFTKHSITDLSACEAAALSVQGWAAGANAASGGVAGWFGTAGLAIDIPATIVLAARNVRATSAAFGFNEDNEREKAFRLMVLKMATDQAEKGRAESIDNIRRFAELLSRPEVRLAVDKAGDWVTEKVIERVARQLGVSIAGRKVGQIVPIAGGVVAAAVNASFQTDVSRAARYAYRLRWMAQRNLLPPPSENEEM